MPQQSIIALGHGTEKSQTNTPRFLLREVDIKLAPALVETRDSIWTEIKHVNFVRIPYIPTTQHNNWRPIFKLKIGQAKVCNLSFASTFLVTFPHKTTQNQRPFSQPSRALPHRLNCRGLRSPHPPRPRIAAATRRLPPHRLPPVAAAVATVSPSSPPSPPALVNQPEAEAAQWRRQRGISRVDAVPRDTQYLWHPRHGGSRGYDFHTQEMMVETYRNEGMQW
jgi:hypothetical protein